LENTRVNVAIRTVFHVPLVGWLLEDAVHGAPDAKYYFVANVVIATALLAYRFGYPFLIGVALMAAALMLVAIVVLTAADLFQPKRPAAAQARRR
jgi:hypothetical protein